jgi:hypothetical protein
VQDLADQVEKLRTIFIRSSTAVPMADEADANEVLQRYRNIRDASDRLFDLLIVLENTGQTVNTLRALSSHFFLANVLDMASEPIAEALNNIRACLPGVVQADGTKIPSRPIEPGAPAISKVDAFVRHFDNETEWQEAMLIGRALAVLKQYPFSNAQTKAVADAATRVKRLGYSFSIHSGKYHLVDADLFILAENGHSRRCVTPTTWVFA